MRLTLFAQFTLLTMLGASVVAVALTIATTQYRVQIALDREAADLSEELRALVDPVLTVEDFRTPAPQRRAQIEQVLRERVLFGRTARASIVRSDGLVLYSTDPSLDDQTRAMTGGAAAAFDGRPHGAFASEPGLEGGLVLRSPGRGAHDEPADGGPCRARGDARPARRAHRGERLDVCRQLRAQPLVRQLAGRSRGCQPAISFDPAAGAADIAAAHQARGGERPAHRGARAVVRRPGPRAGGREWRSRTSDSAGSGGGGQRRDDSHLGHCWSHPVRESCRPRRLWLRSERANRTERPYVPAARAASPRGGGTARFRRRRLAGRGQCSATRRLRASGASDGLCGAR